VLEFAPLSYREAYAAFANMAVFGLTLEVKDSELQIAFSQSRDEGPQWFDNHMRIIRRIQALCDETPNLLAAQFVKAYAIARAGRVFYRTEACATIDMVLPHLLDIKVGDEGDLELKRYLPGFNWLTDFFSEAAELYQGNNEPDKAILCADKFIERNWDGPCQINPTPCAVYTELVCRPKVNRPDKAVELWRKRDEDARPEFPPDVKREDREVALDVKKRFYMTTSDAAALLSARARRREKLGQ